MTRARRSYLGDACALVGDEALASVLYPELAPFSGGTIVIGHGVACYGAADRYLGLLAATLGDHERAVEHFEQALGRQPRHGCHHLGRPHRVRIRPDATHARRQRRRRPSIGVAFRGGDNPDAIIAAAKRAGIPADAVTEVDRVTADSFR